jgi:hypothetical protein
LDTAPATDPYNGIAKFRQRAGVEISKALAGSIVPVPRTVIMIVWRL